MEKILLIYSEAKFHGKSLGCYGSMSYAVLLNFLFIINGFLSHGTTAAWRIHDYSLAFFSPDFQVALANSLLGVCNLLFRNFLRNGHA